MFTNKIRLGNNFHYKDQNPKDLSPGVVYKFSVYSEMSPIMENARDT